MTISQIHALGKQNFAKVIGAREGTSSTKTGPNGLRLQVIIVHDDHKGVSPKMTKAGRLGNKYVWKNCNGNIVGRCPLRDCPSQRNRSGTVQLHRILLL
jgi:hypothetical protein